MTTSNELVPGLRRDDVNTHKCRYISRRHPGASRGPVANVILTLLVTFFMRTQPSAAAPAEQPSCDAVCQIKLIQNDLDKNDLQAAFKKFEIFHATYPGNQEIDPICDQFYQRQSSSQALTADQFGFLLRSACGTSKSPEDILWERGKALFEQRDYLNAERYFERIIQSYPNSQYRSNALAYSSQCEALKSAEHPK
jgi:tetratricopeptide (TPR) repeat protein